MKEIPRDKGVMAQSKNLVVTDRNGPHNGYGICDGGTGGDVSTTTLTP
ncbi:hypothetical protein [Metallosphaera hakonensis]|nr:hypothetical protein [Metallosphaera hakonensis]